MAPPPLDPAFAKRLAAYDIPDLDARADTVYALSGDRRLVYVNPAWRTFALANGARWAAGEWGLGASYDAALPEVLRRFYADLFARARREGAPVDHDYECSSARRHRRMRMRVYPLAPEGWLVVNAIVAESDHPGPASPPSIPGYVDAHGLVVMCAHCRRVRRVDRADGERWDWVPEWVARMPERTSHSLCGPCLAHHYPAA